MMSRYKPSDWKKKNKRDCLWPKSIYQDQREILSLCYMIGSIILYGSKYWTLKGQQEKKVGVVKMSILRVKYEHMRKNKIYRMIVYNFFLHDTC